MTADQIKTSKSSGKRKWILFVVFVLAALGIYGYQAQKGAKKTDLNSVPVYEVKPTRFEIKVVERGTLRAKRSVAYASELVGDKAKLIWMMPEGSKAKAGDLLVRFDDAPFRADLNNYKTELERAKAEVVQAEEELKSERLRAVGAIKAAENNVVMAEQDLKNYVESKGPLALRKLQATLDKAGIDLERAKRDNTLMKEMLQKGFVTAVELELNDSKLKEAQNNYEFSKAEYENTKNFTYPADVESFKGKIVDAKESLVRLKDSLRSGEIGKIAGISRANANQRSADDHIRIANEQINNTKIYSTITGFVIYRENPTSNDGRKFQVGDAVWTSQEVVFIPDTSKMLVDTQIRELDIYKVKTGQTVKILFDAYPDLVSDGKVTLIGALATGKVGGTRYFSMEVALDKSDSRLRDGMSARVEILVYAEDDSLLVPVDAVFDRAGKKICYVRTGTGYQVRSVTLGKSNEDYYQVKKGLQKGDKVLLVEPAEL